MTVTLPAGASVSAEEIKKVEAALEAVAKDQHAPREISLHVTLHVHRDYPKMLYKGKDTRVVHNTDAEAIAAKDGFGPYDHAAYTGIVEE